MTYEKVIRRIGIWTCVCGIISVILYLLHDVIGALNYPGYEWTRQAVSDLTAVDAPSKAIAGQFSSVHGLFSVVTNALLCILVINMKKVLRIGIYLFAAMHSVSAIGYKFFPLTSSGYDGSFSSFMHTYVVTALVVILSIVSLVVIAVGSFKDHRKKLGIGAIIALVCMLMGPVGMAACPIEIFGVVERFSTYSAVVFTGVLGVYGYWYSCKSA